MRFRYTKWAPNPEAARQRYEKFRRLFNFLLLMTDGNVDEAVEMLKRLNEQYNFFQSGEELNRFVEEMKRQGLLEESQGKVVLTRKGGQQVRQDSFQQLFSGLKKSGQGDHATPHTGGGSERQSESHPWQFGDTLSDLDITGTLHNAILREGLDGFTLRESDLEIYNSEHLSSCAVALLIDISHSMILYGEDRITPAKQVALALSQLILTQFPKDSLTVITFGDTAKEVKVEDIPFLSVGPYHTNTKAGLAHARKVLRLRKKSNRQIFMVTDGKPSCITEHGRLYKNAFGLDRKIVNQTLSEAVQCRREGIIIGTFMIAQDSYLVDFVEQLTQANRGRAYYSSLGNLGHSVLVDYVRNRKKKL
jgi:Ca-activated chloride channel homolog